MRSLPRQKLRALAHSSPAEGILRRHCAWKGKDAEGSTKGGQRGSEYGIIETALEVSREQPLSCRRMMRSKFPIW